MSARGGEGQFHRLAAGVCAAVWCGAADAAPLVAGPVSHFSWLRYIAAIALCLTLAVGGALVLKARQGALGRGSTGQRLSDLFGYLTQGLLKPSQANAKMQLVETLRLSNQVDLCLVRYEGQVVIVATSPHSAFVLPLPNSPFP